MSTRTTDTLWVVLDADDQVVLMCSGADAAEVAEEWRARGYRIMALGQPQEPAA